jgi:hypothetical protein
MGKRARRRGRTRRRGLEKDEEDEGVERATRDKTGDEEEEGVARGSGTRER